MTIETVLKMEEKQIFDRKSIRIEPKALAITMVAFANADGGTIAVGVSDDTRTIEGVDFETQKMNELLRVSFDFCKPTVKTKVEYVECVDSLGRDNHVVLLHIEPSIEVHANQADEVFMRVGDKSKKLTFEERLQLMYDKGERYFEDKPVPDAELDDIDMAFVSAYIKKIGYSKTAMEYLRENKNFVTEQERKLRISSAAILLFGKCPQRFFPRARVRFIRYEGIEEKFGTEMNVIKDVIFEGKVLDMIEASINYLDTQIKEKTYLGQEGRFVTEAEYPKFVRQEMIVNAVTHRDYSIRGTDIQIKMFDNRIVVESPGKLPGLVRANNIRYTHFSRNPKIADFLKAYEYVKEYGEGVDRMCKELEISGLQVPEYCSRAFMLQTVINNTVKEKLTIGNEKSAIGDEKSAIGNEWSGFEVQKLSIEKLESRISVNKYNEPTTMNILTIYGEIDTNQIFGAAEIEKILGCSYSTAKAIMVKLREMKVVKEIKGRGKGKYRFIYEGET